MTRPAVVCIHGLGGTPASIAPLTTALTAAGYRTVAPMLAGHGTCPTDLIGRTWGEWLGQIGDVVTDMAAGVVVVGQSMGGTLALQLAATHPSIRGVAAINALVLPADPDATEHLHRLLGRGRTMQPAGQSDLRDPDAHDTAYGELALTALIELSVGADTVHELLKRITVPVLAVSSDRDQVVDPAQCDVLATTVPGPVTRVHLANSGHVAALDIDRDLLIRQLLTWLAALTDESARPG